MLLKWEHAERFFINLHGVFYDCMHLVVTFFMPRSSITCLLLWIHVLFIISVPTFFLAQLFFLKVLWCCLLHRLYVAYLYEPNLHNLVCCRTLEVPSSRIVIIEGIYALNEKLRPFLDLRISVNGGVHFDLVKRVLRDIQRAGQEPSEIIHQVSETVWSSNSQPR